MRNGEDWFTDCQSISESASRPKHAIHSRFFPFPQEHKINPLRPRNSGPNDQFLGSINNLIEGDERRPRRRAGKGIFSPWFSILHLVSIHANGRIVCFLLNLVERQYLGLFISGVSRSLAFVILNDAGKFSSPGRTFPVAASGDSQVAKEAANIMVWKELLSFSEYVITAAVHQLRKKAIQVEMRKE
jgi:hypothetical protein